MRARHGVQRDSKWQYILHQFRQYAHIVLRRVVQLHLGQFEKQVCGNLRQDCAVQWQDGDCDRQARTVEDVSVKSESNLLTGDMR